MDLDNCNCQIDIPPITDQSTDEYLETDSLMTQTVAIDDDTETYYYRIRVVADDEYTRDSYINSDGFDIDSSLYTITLAENDVSTDLAEYVKITWDQPDSSYFYQYEIWRSADEATSDTSLVVIIPDYEIVRFLDRTSGYGTSWYYTVATVDMNGKKYFSNFIRGLKKL